MKVVDYVFFNLAEGVSEDRFLEISKKFNDEFVSKQKGYIKRELLKMDDRWLDIVVWENLESASAVEQTMPESQVAMEFMSLLDNTTMDFKRFNMIKEY